MQQSIEHVNGKEYNNLNVSKQCSINSLTRDFVSDINSFTETVIVSKHS